jgi:hypothetical protein
LGGIVYSWFMLDYLKNNNSNQTFNDYLGGGLNQQHIATKGYQEILVYTFRLPFANKKFGKTKFCLRSGYYIPLDKTTKWTTNNINLKAVLL